MAPVIKERRLVVPISGSPDVVGYRMYFVIAGQVLDRTAMYIDLPSVVPDEKGEMRFNAADLKNPDGSNVFTDGRYDIGIVSVDDAGNESSMSTLLDVPFDFVAPDAPGPIRIEDA